METIASRIGVSLRTVYNWIDDKGGVSPLASAHLDSFLADIETEVAAQRAREIQALTGESSNGWHLVPAIIGGNFSRRRNLYYRYCFCMGIKVRGKIMPSEYSRIAYFIRDLERLCAEVRETLKAEVTTEWAANTGGRLNKSRPCMASS
jgi:hypothetical protein